jgi:hypothetical protein
LPGSPGRRPIRRRLPLAVLASGFLGTRIVRAVQTVDPRGFIAGDWKTRN